MPDSPAVQVDLELSRLIRLLKVLRAEIGRQLPQELDPAAMPLLFTLARCGPHRQGELAEAVVLDPSTTSRYVTHLTRTGLVERQADPTDGRAVQLVATPAGLELAESIAAQRRVLVNQLVEGWPQSDLAEFHRLLGKLNDSVEALRAARTT